MGNLGDRTLFGILLAAGIVALGSGLAMSGVGGRLILGEDNRAAGTTRLTNSTSGDALSVTQNGNGAAVRGATGIGPGIAGAFTSKEGTGVSAVVGSEDRFALYAGNEGAAVGVGGAVRVDGKQNLGLAASSDGASAIVAGVTGSRPAIDARSTSGTAIRATGVGGGKFEDCGRLACAGVAATGAVGVYAATGSARGVGVYAVDQTPAQEGLALVAVGDAHISGSLFVEAGCVGCAQLAIGYNASAQALHQGEAVALQGLDVTQDGVTVLVVGPAARRGTVIGLVDRAVSRLGPPEGSDETAPKWLIGDASVPAGSALRIAIGGLFTLEGPLDGVVAGDQLAVGETPGRLVKATDGDVSVGRYLGTRPDGHGVVVIAID